MSLNMHRSLDGAAIMVYLQWRSQADSNACMNSPAVFAAGKALMDLIQAGEVTMTVQPAEVILSKEA